MIGAVPVVAGKYGATTMTATSTATVAAVLAGADLVALVTGCLTVLVGAGVKLVGDRAVRADAATMVATVEKELDRVRSDLEWHRVELNRLYQRVNELETIADDARIGWAAQRVRTQDVILWARHLEDQLKRNHIETEAKAPGWVSE